MTVKKAGNNNNNNNCSTTDKVKVAVRVRPFNRRECNTRPIVKIAGETVFLAHPNDVVGGDGGGKPPRPFSFDFCFASTAANAGQQLDSSVDSFASSASSIECQNAQQEQVFRAVGMEVVDNAFLGFNTCVFAYGQTGSGKSYTMMGTPEEPGIIPRLCMELFDRAARETNEANRCRLEISFYEIYNERIRDLLGDGKQNGNPAAANMKGRRTLRVREHSLFGPMVEGLSTFVVANYDQMEQLIGEGNAVRTTAATLMNDESSRSHSVFTIKLTQTVSDVDDKTFTGEKVSKISLVDLAGSERAQKTGATGKRLEEGGSINKSLTALGKVIAALAASSSEKQHQRGGGGGASNFIPYRDSVLTWLLKENLGGNSRTTMVATISPSSDNYEETMSTLRFADRAKRIQTHAIVNEDPNAKIIRELREEVDRLRLLNQSHAQQQEVFKQAMEQIAQRHQQDKKMALEQQYEQFSVYIRELTQNLQTPSSSTTPMTPFGMTPSPSMSAIGALHRGPSCRDLNNNGGTSKRRFLEWAHRREELFTGRLLALRQAIQHAHSLCTEANTRVALLLANNTTGNWRHARAAHFSVNLQIPACNLRPSKLALGGGRDEEMGGADEGGGGGGGGGWCICEPVIVANWEGWRNDGSSQRGQHGGGGQQRQMSVEQMECKLAELTKATTALSNGTSYSPHAEEEAMGNGRNHPFMQIFGNLLAKRERHSLIGVANVYLGMLLHGATDLAPIQSQVLIINQQGEICGKLHVQVQLMAIYSSGDDSIGSSSMEDEEEDNLEDQFGDGEIRPEMLLGRTIACRVEIMKATNLPPEHSSLVFCQYSFHEQPEVVVPSLEEEERTRHPKEAAMAQCNGGNGISTTTTVHFHSANEFELFCTRPFLDYLEEDALSIEIWGHRFSEDDEEENEGDGGGRDGGEGMLRDAEEFDGEWEELGEEWWPITNRNHQDVCQVAERKKKSLRERWQEVTKRLEFWMEILELDERGEYAPVPVLEVGQSCSTGGIYRLRPGQQRRIRISLRANGQCEGGGVPICLEDVHAATIGSIVVVQHEEEEETGRGFNGQTILDSYQEVDLARLKAQWEEVLERRANYLHREIHGLTSKGAAKSELEEEREKSLLMNWIELVEERNAISIPTAGIPGAPSAECEMPPGYERHCPLIFLEGSLKEEEEEENAVAAANCQLPLECDETQLGLVFADKQIAENHLNCICPWDSSLHDCPALNRASRRGERVYLLVKVTIRISQPLCLDICLRKRICIQLSSTPSSHGSSTTSAGRWSLPWSSSSVRRASAALATGTGLLVDVVGWIPRSTLDMENRAMLAKLAVQHATNGNEENGEGGKAKSAALEESTPEEVPAGLSSNYLSEYVSKTIQAVEWLIKMDRLRQEEAINRALAQQRRRRAAMPATANGPSLCSARMKRTISLPTTMNNYLLPTSSSFQTKFETIQDDREESSVEGTPVRGGHGQQWEKKAATMVAVDRQKQQQPQQMHPSQSNAEGFQQCQEAMMSSPNSSGYASMVNSLASPYNLTNGTVENGIGDTEECEPVEVGGTASTNLHQQPQFGAKSPSAILSKFGQDEAGRDDGTSPSADGTSLPVQSSTPSTLPAPSCCCENRLFSPPSPGGSPLVPPPPSFQRKLFFQNTINSAASSPSSSSTSAPFLLPHPQYSVPLGKNGREEGNKNQHGTASTLRQSSRTTATTLSTTRMASKQHFLAN